MLSELPFHNLTNEEFIKATGAWVNSPVDVILESRDLFKTVIGNPDKTINNCEEQSGQEYVESKYRSIKQTGSRFTSVQNKGFSILHCNIRSLQKNLTLLRDLLVTLSDLPSIIAITETKLSDNSKENITIPGYKPFLREDSKTSAGGVGFYILDNIKFKKRKDLHINLDEGLETYWIEIERKKEKNIVIGCIYRHPSQNRELFHEALKSKLEMLNSEGSEVFITGDINIDFFKYNTDNPTSDYLDMLLNLGYLPIITKATRITDHTATLIDHIYTNSPQKIVESGICLADITDHLPVFCTIANKLPTSNERKFIRDFSTFREELYIDDLNKVDFKNLITSDVNQSMNSIIETLKEITNKHAPLKKTSNSKQRLLQKPWISKCLLISIKKRQKMFKSHFLSKDPDKVKQYKQYNNKLNKIKELAKRNYFSARFNLFKENIKATWNLIGMLINRKKKSSVNINKLFYNNKHYAKKTDISEKLNSYFINVGPNQAASIPSYDNADPTQYIKRSFRDSFMFQPISVHEVRDAIQALKTNKSYIDIPQKCIKLATDHISESITTVFNNSLEQGIMPNVLKLSKVTPVDKGGELSDPSNYRPISTLSSFAQILEKLIHSQITRYLDKHDILSKYQFGFRKGRSTEQAIVEITDNLKKAIDNNLYTCGVFLDLSKAFDTVNHKILLNKLESYGVRGTALKWFASYLSNRQQFVSINNTHSSKQTVICGIPQGSSLGPLLFLIYINDLPNCSSKLAFRIFADDTNVFASSPSVRNLETIVNEELALLKKWCDINKLSINTKKTNFMIIKSPRKKCPENINIKITNKDGTNNDLEKKDNIKYLGVLLDDKLSWNYHIAFVCSKLAQNTGIFYKLRHYMSLKQLKQLYYSLIYPYISYAILAWGSACKTRIKKIQTKQNSVIRVIFFATTYGKNTESALPIMNLINVLSVTSIFELQALKLAYSWHTKDLPNIFDGYFQYAKDMHSYSTRYARKQNFYKPRARTNIGKQMVSSIVVDLWQDLPPELKFTSKFAFPKRMKQYLLQKQNRP